MLLDDKYNILPPKVKKINRERFSQLKRELIIRPPLTP